MAGKFRDCQTSFAEIGNSGGGDILTISLVQVLSDEDIETTIALLRKYFPKYRYFDTRVIKRQFRLKMSLAFNIAGFDYGDYLYSNIEGKWVIFRKYEGEKSDKSKFMRVHKVSRMGLWKVINVKGLCKLMGWKEGDIMIVGAREGEIAVAKYEDVIRGFRDIVMELINRLKQRHIVKEIDENKYEVILSKEKKLIIEIPEEVMVIDDVWDVDKVGDYIF